MMKQLISITLILILGCTYSSTNAQFNIQEGPELSVDKDAKFDRVIGSDDQFFYVYRIKTRGLGTRYFVEKYDKETLNHVFSKDLNLEQSEDIGLDPNFTSTYTLLSGDNIYIMFPIYYKKLGKKVLAMKSITTDGKIQPGRVDLDESMGNVDYEFILSPDESKFLIVATKSEPDKIDAVSATLYNASDLSVIWERNMPQSYKKSGIKILSYTIDNSGKLAFFFIYIQDFETNEIGTSIAVMDVAKDESNAVDLKFDDGKEPYNLMMRYTEDKRLVCIGIFKDEVVKRSKLPRQAGVFYYIIDANNLELVSSGQEHFNMDIETELTYKSIDGLNPGDKYYASSHLVETGGNYYFLTEHGYNIVGSGTSKVRREVIVSKINGETGRIDWMNLLQKQSQNRSGMYNIMKRDGDIYVICLEHPKVIPYEAKGKKYKPGAFPMVSGIDGCNVRAYQMDADGNISKHIIYKNEVFSYEPQYQDVTLNGENDLLIYMRRGGKEKFGVLSID